MDFLTYLLQASGAPAGAGSATGKPQLIMLVLVFAIFYLFMILPQQKKQKAIKKFREAIKVGDKVVSAGGIHGKVRDIKDNTIVVEIAEGVRITVDKASVFQIPDPAQPAKK